MQIICWSKERKWLGTCPACGCMFVYTGADVVTKKESLDKKLADLTRMEPAERCQVQCPECGWQVPVARMAYARRNADGMGEEEE